LSSRTPNSGQRASEGKAPGRGEALLPVRDPEAARAVYRDILERWTAVGECPETRYGRWSLDCVRSTTPSRPRGRAMERSNPEARARAADTAAKLEAQIAALEDARRAGRSRGTIALRGGGHQRLPIAMAVQAQRTARISGLKHLGAAPAMRARLHRAGERATEDRFAPIVCRSTKRVSHEHRSERARLDRASASERAINSGECGRPRRHAARCVRRGARGPDEWDPRSRR
jgi:hypothetical protein